MSDWSPTQYLKFFDERTRPARDLLAQVPVKQPSFIYDLGCGPGNSTELLVKANPKAKIIGIDSSRAMIAKSKATVSAGALQGPIRLTVKVSACCAFRVCS
jgi:trans-aconitate 2-methyltransferase